MKRFKIKNFGKITKIFIITIIVGIMMLSFGRLNLSWIASAETDIAKTKSIEIEADTAIMNSEDVYNIETLTKTMFGDVRIELSEYLYNLDGSSDFIYVEFENDCGYAIYYKDTMELLEYSAQGSLDYPNNTLKYYGGPSMYLTKQDDCFIDNLSGESFDLSNESARMYSNEVRETLTNSYLQNEVQAVDFDYSSIGVDTLGEEKDYSYVDSNSYKERINILEKGDIDISDKGNTPPSYDHSNLIRVSNGSYISNYQYFLSEPLHGENETGTCGAVAAQLLLSYNNYYNDRRIIADRYLNGGSSDPEKNPNLCADPMLMTTDTLGTRGYHEDGRDDANSYFHYLVGKMPAGVKDLTLVAQLKNILTERNGEISGTINYAVAYQKKLSQEAVDSTHITSEIDSGRPAIILMQSYLGGTNHYVVAYGYQNYAYPNTTTSYLGFITHFGWKTDVDGSYTNIWVNSSWCRTCITLKINHTHSYNFVGSIGTTDRTEYRCSSCGHRTDAAINMSESARYVERVATLPNSNSNTFQDYYVTFKTAGNKLFQTFGSGDAKLYLYDAEYKQLAYNDDLGNGRNSLFSYTVKADTPYIIRTQFYYSYTKGNIKIGITAADTAYSSYSDIQKSGAYSSLSHLTLNTTKVFTYTPTTSGTYTFELNSTYDNYLYVIDPRSSDALISNVDYNDDGGTGLNAKLTKNLEANVTYFVICSKYNPSTSFSSSDSTVIALKVSKDGQSSTPSPSYLNLSLVARYGSIIYNWDVKISNPNSYAVQVTYNSKMCFQSDAKNYTGLSDLVTITIPANSSVTVRINGNGTAGWITTCIDYVSGTSNYRRVTCANGLNGNLTMNTPVNQQIAYA